MHGHSFKLFLVGVALVFWLWETAAAERLSQAAKMIQNMHRQYSHQGAWCWSRQGAFRWETASTRSTPTRSRCTPCL